MRYINLLTYLLTYGLVASTREYRACRRGCHEDATKIYEETAPLEFQLYPAAF